MADLGFRRNRRTGELVFPRKQVAENFRRTLLEHHKFWNPSFEILFWRKGKHVICEVQDSDSPIDHARVKKVLRRARQIRNNPLRMIRLKRHALGLTLAEAAERAGLTRSYWNLIELGHKPLTLTTARQIALVLQLPLTRLFVEIIDPQQSEEIQLETEGSASDVTPRKQSG